MGGGEIYNFLQATYIKKKIAQSIKIIFLKDKLCNLYKFVLILIFVLVERVGVSRMQDFLNTDKNAPKQRFRTVII